MPKTPPLDEASIAALTALSSYGSAPVILQSNTRTADPDYKRPWSLIEAHPDRLTLVPGGTFLDLYHLYPVDFSDPDASGSAPSGSTSGDNPTTALQIVAYGCNSYQSSPLYVPQPKDVMTSQPAIPEFWRPLEDPSPPSTVNSGTPSSLYIEFDNTHQYEYHTTSTGVLFRISPLRKVYLAGSTRVFTAIKQASDQALQGHILGIFNG